MNNSYEALIFDLDGTLVDSAAIVDRVMEKWCDQNGIAFSALQNSAHSSRTEDTVRIVAPHLDAKQEATKIESMEQESLVELKEIRGASHILNQIPKNRWAIATSSNTDSAQAKLDAVNLPSPSILVGADQVKNGKPDPEVYLSTSKSLGCNPSACLAFEDSETGVRSALAAGCQVIIVGSSCKISNELIYGTIRDFEDIELAFTGDSSIKIEIR